MLCKIERIGHLLWIFHGKKYFTHRALIHIVIQVFDKHPLAFDELADTVSSGATGGLVERDSYLEPDFRRIYTVETHPSGIWVIYRICNPEKAVLAVFGNLHRFYIVVGGAALSQFGVSAFEPLT